MRSSKHREATRTAALTGAKRVVVKIGSRLLRESPAGRPAQIADDVAALAERSFAIVSSGAIALGIQALGYTQRPDHLAELQAAAAVGQNRLMSHWGHGFAAHGRTIGQVLLSHSDLSDRGRFLNARYALRALLNARAVPVINENDTVATDEIRYGDNDHLAALVANLIGADALIILTDVDGLLDAPPTAGGVRIAQVMDADSDGDEGEAAIDIDKLAGASKNDGVGSGGMSSKVAAARAAARHGVPTVVANGRLPGVVGRVLRGEDLGTLFVPSAERVSSRKHWIAYKGTPSAAIIVDDGARDALVARGASLLAAGVCGVQGVFVMGEAVSLVTPDGIEFARGLSAYPSADVEILAGRQTPDIERSLGYKYRREIVHADDLVLI